MRNSGFFFLISLFLAPLCAWGEEPVIVVEVPQVLILEGEAFEKSGTAGAIFTVTSNDGFDIGFSGNSPRDRFDADGHYGYPVLTKRDVDASGNIVPYRYDHLETTYGVEISGHESVETGSVWGGGSNSTGSPSDLVKTPGTPGSPDAAIGRIVPNSDPGDGVPDGTARVVLYARGAAAADTQSGNYTVSVTCTVTPDPAP